MRLLTNFILAIAISFFLTPLIRKFAVRFNIVDHPGHRKVHDEPMPVIGGLAIAIAVLVCAFLKPYILGKGLPLLLGGVIILLVNTLDDIRGVSAKIRFGVEFLVIILMMYNGIRISFMPHGLVGDFFEVWFTFIWFLGVINAFNYLDGLDGLCAGSAAINFFYFSIILHVIGQSQLGFLAFIFLGAIIGFLPHNYPKAKIFLGDGGATFLGFMLAGLGVLGEWGGAHHSMRIAIPTLIIGIPIFDMFLTTYTRMKEGKVKTIKEWLEYGGKDHFHHLLVDLGLNRREAVVFIWVMTFSLGLSALMLGNDTNWEGIVTLVQAIVIVVMISVLLLVSKRAHDGWGENKGP